MATFSVLRNPVHFFKITDKAATTTTTKKPTINPDKIQHLNRQIKHDEWMTHFLFVSHCRTKEDEEDNKKRSSSISIQSTTTKMGRTNWMRWLLLLVAVSVSTGQQNHVDLHDDDHNHNPMGCDCMEYWACITRLKTLKLFQIFFF